MRLGQISYRNSRFDQNFEKTPLQKGMCFTGKVDDEGNLIQSEALTYPEFIWVFIENTEYGVLAVETIFNNTFTISYEELEGYELFFEDVHIKGNLINPDYINKVLTGFYNK